jgi:alpha-soluble NSF attachment protein
MDGNCLVQAADAKLKGGFFKCFAGERRFEDALELYQQAANHFKLSKHWEEAAKCMQQCAYCAARCGDHSSEAGYYVDAGNIFTKFSTTDAVEQYELAHGMYSADGQFMKAGKLLMTIAELYESERIEYAETMSFYRRAAELFELDELQRSNFNKCTLKVAEYAAKSGRPEDRQEAMQIFESVGEKALSKNTTAYGAKEQFLRAGLLHLVGGDSVSVNMALEKYSCLDPRFEQSEEGKLLESLAKAFESNDVDLFQDHCKHYDDSFKLDPWKLEQLVKIKEAMQPSGPASLETVDLT